MDRSELVRKRGRRAGILVFSAIVTAFTVVSSAQILRQVWDPEVTAVEIECRAGVQALIEAVRRARRAAASSVGGEREAMAHFRQALNPEWSWRPALTERCRSDTWARKALKEVDLARYAEEHAVRYEATSLTRLRRRIETLENELQERK